MLCRSFALKTTRKFSSRLFVRSSLLSFSSRYVRRFMSEPKSRTIFIGDIHGCLSEFEHLLKKLKITPNDEIICVGDLIAKGPNSCGVLKLVRELNMKSVLGNHDCQLLFCGEHLGFIPKGSCTLPSNCYGDPSKTPEHLELAKQLTKDDWTYLLSLPLYLEVPEHKVLVVHAGLVPGIPYDLQEPADFMKIRNIVNGRGSESHNDGVSWVSLWNGPPFVVFGHDAIRRLQTGHDWAIGLDSGCCYGGDLTAFIMPGREIVQIAAQKNHCPPTSPIIPQQESEKINPNSSL
uniref:Metallophosphatase n=1 Tax=Hirondellea gigas TaxID=1518452 RepID=A0A6A7G9N1_9CRUS